MAGDCSYSKGLAGVIVAESDICPVGVEGVNQILYFGYPLLELAEKFSFDEVAYLLLYKELPDAEHLFAFRTRVAECRGLPVGLKHALELIPKTASPMDMMRTACSFLGVLYPENGDGDGVCTWAERALGALPSAMLYWHHFHERGERVETQSPRAEESVAEHMLRLLHGEGSPVVSSPLAVRALDGSLILYAEHDLAASTFATRVCASTMSDAWSCLTAAIGVLKGPLHGGANEAAHWQLKAWTTPEEATEGVRALLAEKKNIPGFGHRVYMRKGDPRSPIAKKISKALSESELPNADKQYFAVSEAADEAMVATKGIRTNLDFYTASLYDQLGIPVGLFTPIFVVSRAMGWAAHILEQRVGNRLYRPSSSYTGRRETMPLPPSAVYG